MVMLQLKFIWDLYFILDRFYIEKYKADNVEILKSNLQKYSFIKIYNLI